MTDALVGNYTESCCAAVSIIWIKIWSMSPGGQIDIFYKYSCLEKWDMSYLINDKNSCQQ